MTATEQRGAPDHSRRAWGFGLACFFLGPPIGAVLIMLAMPLADAVASGGASLVSFRLSELADYLGSILAVALLSFLFGGLPALASAIWVGIRTYDRGRFGYGEAMVVAALATVLLAPVRVPVSLDPRSWTLGTLALPASIAAAAVVRWVLGRWLQDRRGGAVNPTPAAGREP